MKHHKLQSAKQTFISLDYLLGPTLVVQVTIPFNTAKKEFLWIIQTALFRFYFLFFFISLIDATFQKLLNHPQTPNNTHHPFKTPLKSPNTASQTPIKPPTTLTVAGNTGKPGDRGRGVTRGRGGRIWCGRV